MTSLWASGGFTLRLLPHGSNREAIVSVTGPFGVIGRTPGANLTIDDPAVSARHAYLHLDPRGLFAVDLATRSGTAVGETRAPFGWMRPGDRLEIAGRQVELVDLHLDVEDLVAERLDAARLSPLDDTGDAPLTRLTLYPDAGPRDPLVLNSELVFVGRSPASAVAVASPSARRIQCVLVRGRHAAYLVDLIGRGTWRNDRPVHGATVLEDGDGLMVGSARFQCRVEPFGPGMANLPALTSPAVAGEAQLPALDLAFADLPAPPMHLIPPEAQGAVLGWLMGQIQGRQDDAARRQAELQIELVRLVADIHRDNHAVLTRHFERADAIQRELTELRDEIRRRFSGETSSMPALSVPKLPPLNIAPIVPPEDPAAAAGWLIARVNNLDQENRTGWRDLLGRLSGRKDD